MKIAEKINENLLVETLIMESNEYSVIESNYVVLSYNCVIELKEFFFHEILCSWLLKMSH